MRNNIIGVIVGIIITLIIALYAGISTAEGSVTPVIIIGGIIGLIFLIALKEKVWALLFILPFFNAKLPGLLSKFMPFEFALALILPFYIFNVLTHKSTLTWNKNTYLDSFVTIFGILLVILMIRYPVGVLALSEGGEYVNSAAYIHLSLAIVFFIVASTIKTTSDFLGKILILSVFTMLLSSLYGIAMPVLFGIDTSLTESEDITTSRFSLLLSLGLWCCTFCISRYGIFDLIKKPWFAFLLLFGLTGIALSGFRNSIGRVALYFIVASIIMRRYIDLIIAPVIGVGLLMLLSFVIGTEKLPHGIQRSISFIPGIEIRDDIKMDAQGSTDWRVDMWEWALNEQGKYITDTTWGDGFALEKSEFTRLNAKARTGDTREEFASRGLWHSGPVSAIHRMGYVGLTVACLTMFGLSYYAFITCKIFSRYKYGWAILFLLLPQIIEPVFWIFIFGDIAHFHNVITAIPLVKLLLKCAKNEGLYNSKKLKQQYIPLVMRDANSN